MIAALYWQLAVFLTTNHKFICPNLVATHYVLSNDLRGLVVCTPVFIASRPGFDFRQGQKLFYVVLGVDVCIIVIVLDFRNTVLWLLTLGEAERI